MLGFADFYNTFTSQPRHPGEGVKTCFHPSPPYPMTSKQHIGKNGKSRCRAITKRSRKRLSLRRV